MGLTQKLGTIPLAILTDASNNVGIGAAPSGSYKLEVTGTGRFTGALTYPKFIMSGGSDQSELTNAVNNDFKLTNSGNFRIINNSNTVALLTVTNAGAATFSRNDAGNLSLTLANAYLNQGNLINFQQNKAGSTINAYIGHGGDSSGDFIINNGTQAITIKNGGNVGINCTPNAQFEVLGSTGAALTDGIRVSRNTLQNSQYGVINYTSGILNLTGVDTSGGGAIRLNTSDGTTTSERMRINPDGNIVQRGGTSYQFYKDATPSYAFAMGYSTPATSLSNDFTFANYNGSSWSERMRITSGGGVCVNRTSGSGKFNVDGDTYLYNMSTGAGNSTLKYNTSTGLVTNDSSARIFKKDIVDLQYGLESVLKMLPKKYKWKSNDYEDLGFIADEMYQVIPEIVYLANNEINQTELKDGEPMGINYDRLVPVLVKAMQEQNQIIQELNERLNKAGL